MVYENAVAMFEQEDRGGQLMVGTLIRVGDAWRLVELPSVGDEGEAIAQSTGNFFTPGGTGRECGVDSANIGAETQELVSQLEKIDAKLAAAKDESEIASLHKSRADTVEKLIESSANRTERDTWVRQLVDTLSVAAQTGAYPAGVKRLRLRVTRFCRQRRIAESLLRLQGDRDRIRCSADAGCRLCRSSKVVPRIAQWFCRSLSADRRGRSGLAAVGIEQRIRGQGTRGLGLLQKSRRCVSGDRRR